MKPRGRRRSFRSSAWLACVLGAGACGTSQSEYQQQQQLVMYTAVLEQQAEQERAQAAQTQAAQTQAAGTEAAAAQAQQQAALAGQASVDSPVARVDGRPILAASLATHEAETGLPRAEALADLVDLTLLRAAATQRGVTVPPAPLTPDARASVERQLAEKLALELPPETTSLIVDHAWVKNASTFAERAGQRKTIESLQARALAGDAIPDAFKELTGGIKAADWHIGDHEEYPVAAVPAAARDLTAGSVSSVISADGGLHLFKVYARKLNPPSMSVVHAVVRDRLLEGKVIEVIE